MSTAPLRVYHNPRCSKSRSACALIAENGIAAEVVECRKKGARLTLTIHSPVFAFWAFRAASLRVAALSFALSYP